MSPSRRHRIAVQVTLLSLLSAGLLAPSAALATTTSVQGESLSLPSSQGEVRTDPLAVGAKALIIWSSGTATGSISGAADTVTVRARGDQCGGAPQMTMKLDGRLVLGAAVSARAWTDYTARVALKTGSHQLKVSFSNDYVNSNCDRNLYLDQVTLSQAAPTPTPAATIGPSYFGEHILGSLETNIHGSGVPLEWPSWSPTSVRLWNTYGYNANKGVYEGISWMNINTATGVYDWTLFDAVLAKLKAQGATDLLYTFGYTPAWAGGGTNHDQAPSSNQYLTNFATAVAQRAVADGLPIRSWEVWNEPNNGVGTWTGTTAQMVAMAQTVYGAIKTVDPSYRVLTPSPQGNATVWMSGYLAAGGGAYADIMAFHGYTSSVPETITTLIDSYKKAYATYGQSGKPIWDTEAMDLTTSDPTMQARFLTIYYLLHRAKGVERFYWYAYDADQGQEWFYNTGSSAVSIANIQVHNWMLGATPGSLSQNGTVYSLPLTMGAQQTVAIWNSGGSSAYATGAYTSYTDIQGVVHPISGGAVSIGRAPILLR